MINENNNILIVVDPGHGGWDNGASWEGRLEKDDNLRLGLAVREQLMAQSIPVLMTRDTDVYVTLADRAGVANAAGANLFVSLHRNSYPEQTPTAMGVENYIYLTAPEETTGRAAQLVLDSVVDVGVQADRGVSRGDYYVLRKTVMPAMLLEMGFIINEIDNQLFDEHLLDYAAAIVKGIMQYFDPSTGEASSETLPQCWCPVCPDPAVMQAQILLNYRFGLSMPVTGIFDGATARAAITALQIALNSDWGNELNMDGILCPLTLEAFDRTFAGGHGPIALVLQLTLMLNGYMPGTPDGIFGMRTQQAMQNFQQNNNLATGSGICRDTLLRLFGH